MEVEPFFAKPECETHPIESIDLSKVSTMIFATGYRMQFERLIDVPDLCDETGYPKQYRGESKAMPGLYFLGLPWLHKWQSVTLLGAAEDAEYVANHIASLAGPLPPLQPAATTEPLSPVKGSMWRSSVRKLQAALITGRSFSSSQPSNGAVGTMASPPQLYGDEALTKEFTTYRDLLGSHSNRGHLDAIRAVPKDGRKALTYERLLALLDAQGPALANLGIKRTDRLCSALPNGPESATAFLAFSLACTYAPLNVRSLTLSHSLSLSLCMCACTSAHLSLFLLCMCLCRSHSPNTSSPSSSRTYLHARSL